MGHIFLCARSERLCATTRLPGLSANARCRPESLDVSGQNRNLSCRCAGASHHGKRDARTIGGHSVTGRRANMLAMQSRHHFQSVYLARHVKGELSHVGTKGSAVRLADFVQKLGEGGKLAAGKDGQAYAVGHSATDL